MAHTYTYLLYHAVFSTKRRIPMIEADLKPDLLAYMGGIVRELSGKAYIINSTSDHAHILMTLPASVAVAEALRTIKANSSGWVHDNGLYERDLAGKPATARSRSANRTAVPSQPISRARRHTTAR